MRIVYLEPFDTGSHARFTRVLTRGIDADWRVLTLPGRHWKWRMRSAAVHFALQHREVLREPCDLLVASSFTPLAELRGLVPELAAVPAILYFHENQLAYPSSEHADRDRDLHYGFTQLTSALAATRCVFNSAYNRDSFLEEARQRLARMPAGSPSGWVAEIEARSEVLGLPLELPRLPPDVLREVPEAERAAGPVILWNHRWEHDKNPDAFFAALQELDRRGVAFRVAVCGERYREAPAVFELARDVLGARAVHWGHVEARADYDKVLQRSHLAVSTAVHEFFGVAMLEATHHGARPLVPDRLAYRELFPAEYRYPSDSALVDELEQLVRAWISGKIDLRRDRSDITERHRAAARLSDYRRLFAQVAAERAVGE